MITEALALENGARLKTMDSAHENITDKLDELRQSERQMRQKQITMELLDVVSGAEAMLGERFLNVFRFTRVLTLILHSFLRDGVQRVDQPHAFISAVACDALAMHDLQGVQMITEHRQAPRHHALGHFQKAAEIVADF